MEMLRRGVTYEAPGPPCTVAAEKLVVWIASWRGARGAAAAVKTKVERMPKDFILAGVKIRT